MLTTRHVDNMVTLIKKSKETTKPQAVVDYNQMKWMLTILAVRWSVKWNRKVVFDLLNMSEVNACSIYKTETKKNINITDFKEAIVTRLLDQWLKQNNKNKIPFPGPSQPTTAHVLAKTNQVRCKKCYKELVKTMNHVNAASKTTLKCNVCEGMMYKYCFFQHIQIIQEIVTINWIFGFRRTIL